MSFREQVALALIPYIGNMMKSTGPDQRAAILSEKPEHTSNTLDQHARAFAALVDLYTDAVVKQMKVD